MIIKTINDIYGTKEFESNLVNLIFKKVNNRYEVGDNPFIQISEGISEIKQAEFIYCNKLKSVILPKSLKIINNYAFFSCVSLKYLMFPKLMEGINGSYAFGKCVNLDKRTIKKIHYIPLLSI